MKIYAAGSVHLAVVWILAFTAVAFTPVILMARDYIGSDTAIKSIDQISALYAPYVGMIIAYAFAEKLMGLHKDAAKPLIILAFWLSVIWNVAVALPILRVLWTATSLLDATDLASVVASKLSWLVAPVMGYYFARSGGGRSESSSKL